ncbi:MAG TPA: hypothetical protein VME19_15480 [Streptosporangiaceae bacterium]|nr:hypothetical protein [Streptosporangiaceae bacterium]
MTAQIGRVEGDLDVRGLYGMDDTGRPGFQDPGPVTCTIAAETAAAQHRREHASKRAPGAGPL